MHNETSALPFLGHVPLSRLATRHSRDLACHGGCHLEHRHCTAASGYRSATVDAREAQCLEPLTGDGSVVSASELPSRPLIPTPQVLAHSSDLAGRLGRERSARVALSPGYVAGQNRASSIGSSLVDRTRHCRVTQDHTSDYITNHDTTLPPSYTNPLPPYAVGQSSGYPQHGRDVSAFGDLGNSFAGPTIGLSPAPLHNYTSGQVIDSDVPWSQLSNPLFPSLQQPHPSDDFAIGNIPLPPEQTRTEIELIRPWTLSPYTQPNLSRSNSTSYSTSGGYILSHPYFPTPNQNSSSWSSQEHLGHPYYETCRSARLS
ncbi:hypothetical protein F5141DRAFT_79529 [Pisolithus sp. B1]|nr:hypothetical protein F5141DRAFT_79529 [Pisolithus sp. B1]